MSPLQLHLDGKDGKKSFEYFVTSKAVTDQKRGMLSHHAGVDVQDIFETLTETGDDYDTAIAKLDEYSAPQVNVIFERHSLRQMSQNEDETVDRIVMKLKQKASTGTCEFGDTTELMRLSGTK